MGHRVFCETIRAWTLKFGPKIAANLRRHKQPPSPRWHLNEMVCKIGGERVFLWRAVDDQGEVLDLFVQKRRDTRAAMKLLKQVLHSQPVEPESIVTDGLASYGSALHLIGRRGGGIVPIAHVRTIAPRTRICRSGGASERCSYSNPENPLSDF